MCRLVPSEFDSISTGPFCGPSTSTWMMQPSSVLMSGICPSSPLVVAGLCSGHPRSFWSQDVDARNTSGHDDHKANRLGYHPFQPAREAVSGWVNKGQAGCAKEFLQ